MGGFVFSVQPNVTTAGKNIYLCTIHEDTLRSQGISLLLSLFSSTGAGKYPQCADAPTQAIEREPPLRILPPAIKSHC